MSQSKVRKSRKGEIIALSIGGAFIALALIFLSFGIAGDHFAGKASENWVSASEKAWLAWSKMGYRWWGVIDLAAGALITVIALNATARTDDRDEERALRRKQRLMLEEEAEKEADAEKGIQEVASTDANSANPPAAQ